MRPWDVLIPYDIKKTKITAKEQKKIDILPVFPDEVEILPWAGHLGAKLADKIVPIILEIKIYHCFYEYPKPE